MTPPTPPTSLVIFITSQTPTPLRYPHPAKPSLVLPQLLHTSLHAALDKKPPSVDLVLDDRGGSRNENGTDKMEVSGARRTVFVPSKRDLGVDGVEDDGEEVIEVIQNEKKNANGINDEDEDDDECEDSEITVKFHLVSLPASPVTPSRKEDSEVDTISTQQAQIRRGLDIFESHIRPRWCRTPQGRSGRSTRENSVDSLSSSPTTSPTTSTLEKKRGQIDTFLIGWKGIDYIGQKQESDRDSFDDETEDQTQVQARLNGSARKGGCGSAKLASKLEADREREQAQARAKEFVSGASEWDNLSEQKQNDIVQLWRSLPSLVPSAQKFGTLSLPLSLLKLLSTTTSPTSSGVTPSKNSDPSSFEGRQAEISGKVVDHIEATTLQHDTAEAHASVAARDANADESTKAASRVAHTEDYHLLERFIATPPNGSSSSPSSTSTKNENELGNGNEIATDHSSKANGSTAKESRVRGPSVNILNTPDCHHLPRELMQFASENGIELWAGGGGEGSDPLPSTHLHNALKEFMPQFPKQYLPPQSSLGTIAPFDSEEGGKSEGAGQKLGVNVEWVLSYTVISKARNVLQDKGYIIYADLL